MGNDRNMTYQRPVTDEEKKKASDSNFRPLPEAVVLQIEGQEIVVIEDDCRNQVNTI